MRLEACRARRRAWTMQMSTVLRISGIAVALTLTVPVTAAVLHSTFASAETTRASGRLTPSESAATADGKDAKDTSTGVTNSKSGMPERRRSRGAPAIEKPSDPQAAPIDGQKDLIDVVQPRRQ